MFGIRSIETTGREPLRFRWPLGEYRHPVGADCKWLFGVYFRSTDLYVTEMGERGTGCPRWSGIEWLDQEA